MRVIDITVDLETLALTPNAAIVQIAAVAWARENEVTPFCYAVRAKERALEHLTAPQEDLGFVTDLDPRYMFDQKIDLRSCVALNMDFDQKTVEWWSRQDEAVKISVLSGRGDGEPLPGIKNALMAFISWAKDIIDSEEAPAQLRLWSQGTDFDISILRNAAHKCGVTEQFDAVFPHTSLRDARTFILELGKTVTYPFFPLDKTVSVKPSSIYANIPPYDNHPDGKAVHDAMYDCLNTSWNVWQVMKLHSLHYPAPEE